MDIYTMQYYTGKMNEQELHALTFFNAEILFHFHLNTSLQYNIHKVYSFYMYLKI